MGNNKSSVSGSYIVLVGIGAFSLAVFFSVVSELLVRGLSSATAFLILLMMILIGISFDIFGTAVTAANETPFHAMAAKRVLGAQQSVMLLRNADRVANISLDVVGDIAGTVSGALGISIVAQIIMENPHWDIFILNVLVTASVASLTISGKALGKKFALRNANTIVFFVGKNIARVEKSIGRDPYRKRRRPKE
ncbi:hypothetical protein [Desulfofalx alkaliphila]|uniref:hypothetical protein n=1 Tax=Desulfofalx alkaliphila TaxID=105483 RepID=UPI0004E1912D|nr:hypothetical protein [Desulfofalx alkaliphila]